jgi:trans-aconitate methyltransferase
MQENKLPQGIVVGIDISPAMLSHATTHYPPQHYPQLFFMQGDATNLPFLNQFDLVTSFCCMHWISDQKLVLRNIRSALMPLGKTLIVIPAKNEKSHMAIAQKLIQSKRWKESFVGFIDPRKYYTPSEFSQMLLEENLTPVSVQEIPTTIVYDNLDDFKSFLRLISQYVQFLPLDKQDEFMDDLIEQLIVFHTLDEDGKLNYEITKLEAIAERNEQE